MASPIRQINSPGVEIREIDKSFVAPTMVGTATYIMGFADKGEIYNPINLTSVGDLETNFGRPTNEAEVYFYNACKEVMNEGSVLYAAKLPYNNDMDVNYKCIELTVAANDPIALSAAADYSYLSAAYVSLSGYPIIEGYKHIELGSVELISQSTYDVLVAGGAYTGGGDFLIVNENKQVIGGINDDEGLFVAIVDPFDGMLKQRIMASTDTDIFNIVSGIVDGSGSVIPTSTVKALSGTYAGTSISEDMAAYFPSIEYTENGANLDPDYFSWITVVVGKTVEDANNNNKLGIIYLEAWSGSLLKEAKDASTGQSSYIVDIINAQSSYIKMYKTNPVTTLALDQNHPVMMDADNIKLLTFSDSEAEKLIIGSKIVNDMRTCFEKVKNIDELQIDIVVDAGLSTIAEFCDSAIEKPNGIKFEPDIDLDDISFDSSDKVAIWRDVCSEFINFCQNERKDCMVILDVPRNLAIKGNQKVIRKTAPENTFSNSITPKLKFITGLNSSYAALYADWMKMVDSFSGKNMWIPPSIKAAGIYVRTDRIASIWDAPAGLNRGIIGGINDIAFNPAVKEADVLYSRSFNYCKQYPFEGFILEGQKTTQVKRSAFDRVNVRRLFLRLERFAYQASRYFVMEPNNDFTRRRLVNTLNPTFASIQAQGGMYDYLIVCSEENNTPEVIDNNELKVAILIKPVRTAEFILIDFIATRTDANFSEFI